MSLQEKFNEFLNWQYSLIYGPTEKAIFSDGVYLAKTDWERNRNTRDLDKPIFLSTTGKSGNCCVCSPFGNMFLGFWFNYHATFKSSLGEGTNAMYGLSIDKENAYQHFLEKIPREDGTYVWKWRSFVPWLKELRDFKAGTIFICGGHGHVFLIVRFGSKFNFPKKYIFGEGASGLCDVGWYMIHASGPKVENINISCGLVFSSVKTTHPRGQISAVIAKLKKLSESTTFTSSNKYPDIDTYKDLAENLKNGLDRDAERRKFKICRGTPLFWMNGRICVEKWDDSKPKETLQIVYALNSRGEEVASPLSTSLSFDVYRLADILDEETGWVSLAKASNNDQKEDIKKKKLSFKDCRPITFG
jgi:hypothetical protein